MRQAEKASPIIAYVWTPYFATAVARRAGPQPGPGPLALLDERSRVLAADAAATAAGVVPGLDERQAAARCPGVTLLPAGRFPLWEAQERFLGQNCTTRCCYWKADCSGRAARSARWRRGWRR